MNIRPAPGVPGFVPSLALVFALALASLSHAEPLRLRPDDPARGLSGKLRAVLAPPGSDLTLTLPLPAGERYRWVSSEGDATAPSSTLHDGAFVAPATRGLWTLELSDGRAARRLDDLTVITTVPASLKRNGWLNGYHIGFFPTEGQDRAGAYAAPSSFIEVTAANQDLRVSEHFRLQDFLTHDQAGVWPKYLVLNLRLIDKLECLIAELHVSGLHVMSGYRTPAYNGPGGDGRVKNSRHTFGDAADVWVDEDGDGRMDDLNHDGRVNADDAAALAKAVERVERRFPALTGGAGVYRATSAHGPFVHVDARGRPARWASR